MSVFDTIIKKIEENGMYYYIVPTNFPLFKAIKKLDKDRGRIFLRPDGFYFFGVKDMSPEYIESYENEYGIIFEFITTREYKLLALDDKKTQTQIYNAAPENIKDILENNYGYISGKRNSVSGPDRDLSKYLCENNYDGYAIHDMVTDLGGTFHDEFMICKMDGIEYVEKVTPDYRMAQILEKDKLDTFSKEMKESRKKKVRTPFSDSQRIQTPIRRTRLFDDEEDNDAYVPRSLFGGKGRKSLKKKRTPKKGRSMRHLKKKNGALTKRRHRK